MGKQNAISGEILIVLQFISSGDGVFRLYDLWMCNYLEVLISFKLPTFQNLMAEFSNSLHGGGWVHSVSFSSDGNRLAWVGHDSSVSVADATSGMAIYKVN